MKKLFVGVLLTALLGSPQQSAAKPTPWLHNLLVVSSSNQSIEIKVLVLNYDPRVPSQRNKRLRELFNWNDPHDLAREYQKSLEQASGGAIRFKQIEWRDLDEIYAQMDGYRYSPDEYYRLRKSGVKDYEAKSGKGKGWHDGKGQDYPRLLKEQKVDTLINSGSIDEVWIFGDHYFGLWEASMAGPGAFYINGGVYPDFPTKRPFAFYGFNYERGVAEMLHDTCHRTEATLNHVFGAWNLTDPKNDWELFSANSAQSNKLAGVGTCHYPLNAGSDYDYQSKTEVQSWALDFLNYPNLQCRDRKSARKMISCETWMVTNDAQKDYLMFYFGLLPRASGKTAGFENNWWKYVFDFNRYKASSKPNI